MSLHLQYCRVHVTCEFQGKKLEPGSTRQTDIKADGFWGNWYMENALAASISTVKAKFRAHLALEVTRSTFGRAAPRAVGRTYSRTFSSLSHPQRPKHGTKAALWPGVVD